MFARAVVARPAKGQALVMGLVALFMGTITLFYVFNTGQVSADKQRLTNAADAAAYSGALWRARVLNYHAYSNRAMIANEVAISQTITLASDLQFHKNFAACLAQEEGDGDYTCEANLAVIAQIIPYFPEIADAVYEVYSAYEPVVNAAVPGELLVRSTVMNTGLSKTQTFMDAATMFTEVEKIADQVAKANDPHFSASILPDGFWGERGFTRQYEDDDRNRIANLVREGMDPYSVDRGFTFASPMPCDGYALARRGGTGLDSSLEHWEAVDNASEWRRHLSWDGCDEDENPMGWGDRQASADESDRVTGDVDDNPEALDLARDSAEQPEGYVGIQPFRDLNYESLDDEDAEVRNPTHKLAIVVHMQGTSLRTANTLNVGVGRLRMSENLHEGELSSLAAAEVFFKRPVPRSDGRTEYPSLFNPYWQARLAEPSASQRLLAAALL